jgi:excisionase family DNA binding protein
LTLEWIYDLATGESRLEDVSISGNIIHTSKGPLTLLKESPTLMRPPEQERGLFDVREAARRMGVRPGLVRKLVKDELLTAHRTGRLLRFSQQGIDEYLSRQKVGERTVTKVQKFSQKHREPCITPAKIEPEPPCPEISIKDIRKLWDE